MHSVHEVLAIIRHLVQPLPITTLPLLRENHHAPFHTLALAEDILLDIDMPPFDRAVVDGYAVRSIDLAGPVTVLKIVGRQDAGGPIWAGELNNGECVAINTGGPIPKGADAVVMVEQTKIIEVSPPRVEITLLKGVSPGVGLQRRGADGVAGNVVLSQGTRLTPAAIAVATAGGNARVRVRGPVKIAVLSTGDELVTASQNPGPGQIRDANRPMLLALARQLGALPDDLGTCGDDLDVISQRINTGLDNADILLVTGGMSMGTKDLVPQAFANAGCTFHVEKVSIKPGKPFVFATVNRNGRTVYIAGLPGNPVSAFVTFTRFVRLMCARLLGAPEPQILVARLSQPLPVAGDREFYCPCTLSSQGAIRIAEPLPWKGSADIFTLAKATGLIIIPPSPATNGKKIEAQDEVAVLEL